MNILLSILIGLMFSVTYMGEYTITRYTCSAQEGTEDCITASGQECRPGTVASYPGRFRFGTLLYIEGLGIVSVLDTGTGYRDRRPWIDIWTPDRDYAFDWGIRRRRVWLLQ